MPPRIPSSFGRSAAHLYPRRLRTFSTGGSSRRGSSVDLFVMAADPHAAADDTRRNRRHLDRRELPTATDRAAAALHGSRAAAQRRGLSDILMFGVQVHRAVPVPVMFRACFPSVNPSLIPLSVCSSQQTRMPRLRRPGVHHSSMHMPVPLLWQCALQHDVNPTDMSVRPST